jgi:hypothetical protein
MMTFPIYGKIKAMFQTTNQLYSHDCVFFFSYFHSVTTLALRAFHSLSPGLQTTRFGHPMVIGAPLFPTQSLALRKGAYVKIPARKNVKKNLV